MPFNLGIFCFHIKTPELRYRRNTSAPLELCFPFLSVDWLSLCSPRKGDVTLWTRLQQSEEITCELISQGVSALAAASTLWHKAQVRRWHGRSSSLNSQSSSHTWNNALFTKHLDMVHTVFKMYLLTQKVFINPHHSYNQGTWRWQRGEGK